MSHKATQWAISLRGLKPATKIVLWHLCDRHNPDQGCFPTQDRLAYDAEVSRSGLNNHLNDLEAAGLIRREKRIDPTSRQQISTRYILRFEPEFDEAPCPKSGHGNDADPCPKMDESRVQTLDTNPVREPVKKKKMGENAFEFSQAGWVRLLDIAGHPDPSVAPSWWRGQVAVDHVQGWISAYGFTETEILGIAAAAREGRKEKLEGPKGLDADMRRAAKSKAAGGELKAAKKPGKMTHEETVQFYAEWVNSDRYIPQNHLRTSIRAELIGRGLVTEQRCNDRLQA